MNVGTQEERKAYNVRHGGEEGGSKGAGSSGTTCTSGTITTMERGDGYRRKG